MKLPRYLTSLFVFGVLIAPLLAQDPEQKKPAANEDLPGGFRSFIVRDERFPIKDDKNRTGKLHCLVCENGLNPVLAVFSRTIPNNSSSPLALLIQKQEALAKQFANQKLGCFAIFLGLNQLFEDDQTRETKIAEVANFGRQLSLKNVPLGLTAATELKGDKPVATKQVADFKIADGDDITVIFYDRLKVIKRWSFTANKGPTEEDLQAIDAVVVGYLKK